MATQASIQLKVNVNINVNDRVEVLYDKEANNFFNSSSKSIKIILPVIAIDDNLIWVLLPQEIVERSSVSRRMITQEMLSKTNFSHISNLFIGRIILNVSGEILRKVEKTKCNLCKYENI